MRSQLRDLNAYSMVLMDTNPLRPEGVGSFDPLKNCVGPRGSRRLGPDPSNSLITNCGFLQIHPPFLWNSAQPLSTHVIHAIDGEHE